MTIGGERWQEREVFVPGREASLGALVRIIKDSASRQCPLSDPSISCCILQFDARSTSSPRSNQIQFSGTAFNNEESDMESK